MFWIILLTLSGLAGLAFGWITVQSSSERITISLEKTRIRPVVATLKEGASGVLARGRQFFEHSRHS